MKITHRAPADASAATTESTLLPASPLGQVPRLSCCCRLSELLPLVRQMHDAARDARSTQQDEQADVAA